MTKIVLELCFLGHRAVRGPDAAVSVVTLEEFSGFVVLQRLTKSFKSSPEAVQLVSAAVVSSDDVGGAFLAFRPGLAFSKSIQSRSRSARCKRWQCSKRYRHSLERATLRPIRSEAATLARWQARMTSPRVMCLSTCTRAISKKSRFIPLSIPRPRGNVGYAGNTRRDGGMGHKRSQISARFFRSSLVRGWPISAVCASSGRARGRAQPRSRAALPGALS